MSSANSVTPLGCYDFWRGEYNLLRPVPVTLDRKVAQFCRRWSKKGEQARATQMNDLGPSDLGTLFMFARRAATLALRNYGPEWLDAGFTATAMLDAGRFDFRDILHILALLNYAALRLGSNAGALLKEAACLTSAATRETINGFLKRSSRTTDVRHAGRYDEVEIDGQVGLIDRGCHPYSP